MRALAAACLCVALAGCADYAPPPPPQALNISPGVWRLTSAAGGQSRAGLRVLRRAADLTLAQGGDWFRVLDRERGADGESYDFESGSSDAGDLLSSPGPLALATVEIEIGRGPKPTDQDVYDAHQVADAGGRHRRYDTRPGAGSNV